MTSPRIDFDQVLHGLEEAFAFLDGLIDQYSADGIIHPEWLGDAESARDNLGNALTEHKAKTEQGHAVIAGNLTEGFTLYGPYVGFEDAAAASEGGEVWITRLHTREQAKFDF